MADPISIKDSDSRLNVLPLIAHQVRQLHSLNIKMAKSFNLYKPIKNHVDSSFTGKKISVIFFSKPGPQVFVNGPLLWQNFVSSRSFSFKITVAQV